MSKKILLRDLEPFIREALDKGQSFPLLPHGQSMLPLLRPGIDTIFLSPLPENIKKGDILLFKREDGTFVLHRVMKYKGDSITFCGDGQTVFEEGIKKEQLIAIVETIFRDGEKIFLPENKKYLVYKKKILAKKKISFAFYKLKAKIKKYL